MVDISLIQEKEIEEAARVLSMAMLDTPIHVAVYQGQGEKQRLEIESLFNKLLNHSQKIVFVAKENKQIVGVMRMRSCLGKKETSEIKKPVDLEDQQTRQAIWLNEWTRNDPKKQHWHLGPIGVLPAFQGKGIGRMLLDRFCMETDQCRANAYLETDRAINVKIYQRFGFKVLDEVKILGVPNWYMWRERRESLDTTT